MAPRHRLRALGLLVCLCAPTLAVRSESPLSVGAVVDDFDRGASRGKFEAAVLGALLQRHGGAAGDVLEIDDAASVALHRARQDPTPPRRQGHIRVWPHKKPGNGSFGRVFEGEVVETKEPVAIKVFKSEPYMARCRAALRLFDSPHIVRCIGALSTEHKGRKLHMLALTLADCDLTTAMGRIHPSTFRATMPRNSSLSLLDILEDILRGLQDLELQGVVHRDIKPDNVVLVWNETRRRHVAMLADFDMACMPADLMAAAHNLICTSWAGTRRFFAPELLAKYRKLEDGTKVYDPYTPHHKHDVFAAALTLLSTPGGFLFEEWVPAVRRATSMGIHSDVAFHLAARQVLVLEKTRNGFFDYLTKAFENWLGRATPTPTDREAATKRFRKVVARMLSPKIEERCTATECLELLLRRARPHRRSAAEYVP